MKTRTTIAAACLAAALTYAAPVLAHDASAHANHATAAAPARKEQQPWGIAGEARDVKRTIRIAMSDDMRFTPSLVEVKEGETVRFVLQNRGKALHEMVIGTKEALDRHAAQMQKSAGMAHDEPHMAHVAAGQQGAMVWKFNRVGEFEFACLIPGHYQAGMVGKIRVAR